MPDQSKRGLTAEELEQEDVNELPDREEMALIDGNVAAPVNLAAALNVITEDSTAYANAEQTADISQTTGEEETTL